MNRPGGVTIIAIGHLLGGVFGLMEACAILAIPIPAILPWQRPKTSNSFPVPRGDSTVDRPLAGLPVDSQ